MEILTLGQKIKKLRKKRSLTLKELAEDRITAAQISHIERDKSYPSQDLLEYFSLKLGVDIDYLVESKEKQARKIGETLLLQAEICVSTQEFEKAEEIIDKIQDVCKAYSIEDLLSKACYLSGAIYENQQMHIKAVNSLKKALFLSIKNEDKDLIFKLYIKIGEIYISQKCFTPAIDNLNQAIECMKNYNVATFEEQRKVYTYISKAYIECEDKENAIKYSKLIDEIEEKINDYTNKGNTLYIKGCKLLEDGMYQKAKEIFESVIKIYNDENKKNQEAIVYKEMSKVYSKLYNDEESLNKIKKAYMIKKDYEDEQLVEIIFDYIEKLTETKDYENAKKYAKRALSIAIKLKNKILEFKSIRNYAKIHMDMGDMDTARENINRCIHILKVSGCKKDLADLYFELGKTYEFTSKENQIIYYNKGIELYKELRIMDC